MPEMLSTKEFFFFCEDSRTIIRKEKSRLKITTTRTVMILWKGILRCTGDKQATKANSAPAKPSDGSKSVSINAKLQPLAVPSFDGNKAHLEE